MYPDRVRQRSRAPRVVATVDDEDAVRQLDPAVPYEAILRRVDAWGDSVHRDHEERVVRGVHGVPGDEMPLNVVGLSRRRRRRGEARQGGEDEEQPGKR